jgi:hypothetical protein
VNDEEEGCRQKQQWPILRYYFSISLGNPVLRILMSFALLVVVWLHHRKRCASPHLDNYWLRLTHNLPFLYVVASFISMKLQL